MLRTILEDTFEIASLALFVAMIGMVAKALGGM